MIAVPAYWAAGTPAGATAFDRLVAAAPALGAVVVNGPASGPAEPFDPALATVIGRLRAGGVEVLGYVDTGYLGGTGAVTTRHHPGSTESGDWRIQAGVDARTWLDGYRRYGLSGVFLDRTPAGRGADDTYLRAYRDLVDAVRRGGPATVVINPGVPPDERYTEVADVIVVVEDSYAAYRHWRPPSWIGRHPPSRFWHLVHGAATARRMRTAVELARRRNAGHLYVTDAVVDESGGPWNTLPARPYWHDQLVALAGPGTSGNAVAASRRARPPGGLARWWARRRWLS